jgi:hypothetical protein
VLRRKFTKEFKVEACKLVLEKGQGIQEVSQNLGIGEGMLGRWIRTYRSNRGEAFPGRGETWRGEINLLFHKKAHMPKDDSPPQSGIFWKLVHHWLATTSHHPVEPAHSSGRSRCSPPHVQLQSEDDT